MAKTNTHRWTLKEDTYCCQEYFNQYVAQANNLSISDFTKQLEEALPDIKSTSLRMKIQNTKQILIELNISDSLETRVLKNYSKQNYNALIEVLRKNGYKV